MHDDVDIVHMRNLELVDASPAELVHIVRNCHACILWCTRVGVCGSRWLGRPYASILHLVLVNVQMDVADVAMHVCIRAGQWYALVPGTVP